VRDYFGEAGAAGSVDGVAAEFSGVVAVGFSIGFTRIGSGAGTSPLIGANRLCVLAEESAAPGSTGREGMSRILESSGNDCLR